MLRDPEEETQIKNILLCSSWTAAAVDKTTGWSATAAQTQRIKGSFTCLSVSSIFVASSGCQSSWERGKLWNVPQVNKLVTGDDTMIDR